MIEDFFFFAIGYISLALSMVLYKETSETSEANKPLLIMTVSSVVLIIGGATNIFIATLCSLALLVSATFYLTTGKEEKSYRVALFSTVIALSALGSILGLYRSVQNTFPYTPEAPRPRLKVLVVCATTSAHSITQVWTALIDLFGRQLDVTIHTDPSSKTSKTSKTSTLNTYRIITHPWLEEVCTHSYDIVCFNDCIPVKDFLDIANQLVRPENRGRCPNMMIPKFVFLDKAQLPIVKLSAYFYLSRDRKDVATFLSLFDANEHEKPYHKLSYASIARQSHLSDAREEWREE